MTADRGVGDTVFTHGDIPHTYGVRHRRLRPGRDAHRTDAWLGGTHRPHRRRRPRGAWAGRGRGVRRHRGRWVRGDGSGTGRPGVYRRRRRADRRPQHQLRGLHGRQPLRLSDCPAHRRRLPRGDLQEIRRRRRRGHLPRTTRCGGREDGAARRELQRSRGDNRTTHRRYRPHHRGLVRRRHARRRGRPPGRGTHLRPRSGPRADDRPAAEDQNRGRRQHRHHRRPRRCGCRSRATRWRGSDLKSGVWGQPRPGAQGGWETGATQCAPVSTRSVPRHLYTRQTPVTSSRTVTAVGHTPAST